jgi:alkanesulfonate monooxygenase
MTPFPELQLLSSCPDSIGSRPDEYFRRVLDAARWAEQAGHQAFLIHSSNQLADPWVVAQMVMDETAQIAPIVTVQPLYSHPYAVAKKVATLAQRYGRAPHLNLAAGPYRADLLSLGDSTPHDERYARLVEFGTVIRQLLRSEYPVVFDGDFYRLHKPAALPPLPLLQQPGFFVCAASEAGRAAAIELGATTVHDVTTTATTTTPCVRLGVIARETEAAAWDAAHARFPVDHATRFARRLEMAWSDSRSLTGLQAAAVEESTANPHLWLAPFENRQAHCAYLVGSHSDVAKHVRRLMDAGAHTFLLDDPASETELEHTRLVFERAWKRYCSPLAVSA